MGRAAYHHGDLRNALIASARAQVERTGPDGVSLRGAARDVGVTQTAPYRHFQDKDSLLAAVAEQGFEELRAAMLDAGTSKSSPRTRLLNIGQAYVAFALNNPHVYRLMFGRLKADAETHPELHLAGKATLEVLVEVVASCQEAGLIPGRDPRAASLTAWSAVHGLSTLALDGHVDSLMGDHDPQAIAKKVTRVLWDGLGVRPS